MENIKQLTILAVDDDPAYTRLFQYLLTAKGYRVLTVGSAPEALELIKKESQKTARASLEFDEASLADVVVRAAVRATPVVRPALEPNSVTADRKAVAAVLNQVVSYDGH